MGNRFSVAQDERDEAEFRYLVQAVEIAQQRARVDDDLEAGPDPNVYYGRSYGGGGQIRTRADPLGLRVGDYNPLAGVHRHDNNIERVSTSGQVHLQYAQPVGAVPVPLLGHPITPSAEHAPAPIACCVARSLRSPSPESDNNDNNRPLPVYATSLPVSGPPPLRVQHAAPASSSLELAADVGDNRYTEPGLEDERLHRPGTRLTNGTQPYCGNLPHPMARRWSARAGSSSPPRAIRSASSRSASLSYHRPSRSKASPEPLARETLYGVARSRSRAQVTRDIERWRSSAAPIVIVPTEPHNGRSRSTSHIRASPVGTTQDLLEVSPDVGTAHDPPIIVQPPRAESAPLAIHVVPVCARRSGSLARSGVTSDIERPIVDRQCGYRSERSLTPPEEETHRGRSRARSPIVAATTSGSRLASEDRREGCRSYSPSVSRRYCISRSPPTTVRCGYSRSRSPPIIVTSSPQSHRSPSPPIIVRTFSHRSRSPPIIVRPASRLSQSPPIMVASGPQARHRSWSPIIIPLYSSGRARSRSPTEHFQSGEGPPVTLQPLRVTPPPLVVRTAVPSRRPTIIRAESRTIRSQSPVVIRGDRECSTLRGQSVEGRNHRSRSPPVAMSNVTASRRESPSVIMRTISRARSRSPTPVRIISRSDCSRSPRCIINTTRSRSPIPILLRTERRRRSRSRSPPFVTKAQRPSRSPSIIVTTQRPPDITAVVQELRAIAREMEQSQAERIHAWQERDERLLLLLHAMERRLTRRAVTATRSRSPSTHSGHSQKSADNVHIVYEKQLESARFKAYPNIPYAAGLAARNKLFPCSPTWRPAWTIFPLKAFRGSDFTYLKIEAHWDDEALLRELSRTYDRLRTVWRKWFFLRSVSSITMVLADHSFVYPQRLGPAGVSPSKNMRLRYLLANPRCMRGRYEFMQVLTARTDLGIEFVERFQLRRIAIAVLLPVALSTILGVLYSVLTGDVSSAFTISGYMTSAYSVCLVLVGILNLVEF